MTSINTNIAATTALRTLQSTNMQLDQTQGRIATGLRIGEAKDNAAYWSIATTLKSDNKALGTVKDALGLGAATVDTAYTALNSTLGVLNEIKSKLTAATQSGVNRDVIQAEIAELQKQLKSVADSASFSGENWLSIDSGAAGFSADKSVVASFNRTATGAASLETIDIDISKIKLYDSNGTTGLLDGDQNASGFALATAGTTTVQAGVITFAADSNLVFSVTNNGSTKQVTIDKALVDGLGFTGSTLRSNADVESLYNAALTNAGVSGVAVSVSSSGVVSFNSQSAFSVAFVSVAAGSGTSPTPAKVTQADLGLASPGNGVAGATITTKSVADMDISKAALDALGVNDANEIKLQLESYISIVNKTIDSVTSAASTLGAVASRIELQQTFVSNLMDTIDAGISGLVDADMNEESTRLQALQVKQQLGVQALSIANQSAQNVLRLFQ